MIGPLSEILARKNRLSVFLLERLCLPRERVRLGSCLIAQSLCFLLKLLGFSISLRTNGFASILKGSSLGIAGLDRCSVYAVRSFTRAFGTTVPVI